MLEIASINRRRAEPICDRRIFSVVVWIGIKNDDMDARQGDKLQTGSMWKSNQ